MFVYEYLIIVLFIDYYIIPRYYVFNYLYYVFAINYRIYYRSLLIFIT